MDANINAQIIHDGVDISNKVLHYDRAVSICEGIGTVNLDIEWKSGRVFHPWDEIVIFENGDKKGTFFVDFVGKEAASGYFSVRAQDNSKRASDYFVTEAHNIDGITYARYWIELFLAEAGIDYEFTVADQGAIVAPNSGLGFDSVYNITVNLIQQSGWYIYYNPNGKAIIGHLNKSLSSADYTLDHTSISAVNRERDDGRLRNRAVVWGNASTELGAQVFVDIYQPTPYDVDSNDKRTVVFASPSLYDYSKAVEIAAQMLDAFTKIKDEKRIVCSTAFDIRIGDVVKILSSYWSGNGLVTSVECSVDNSGFVYTITLDEQCPRLFTYFAYYPPVPSGGWVYTGHWGDGIWRKHTESTTWYNDSSGLENLYVLDMFIKDEVFAAVADDGYLYTKTSEFGSWNKFYHGSLRNIAGTEYPEIDTKAVACSINALGNIIVGYNATPVSGIVYSGYESWVLEVSPLQTLIKAENVTLTGGARILDLESAGDYNILSVESPGTVSGYEYDGIVSWFNYGIGDKSIQYFTGSFDAFGFGGNGGPDDHSYNYGTPFGHTEITNIYTGNNIGTGVSALIYDNLKNYWYCNTQNITRFEVNNQGTAPVVTSWNFTEASEVTTAKAAGYEISIALNQRFSSQFDIIYFWYDDAIDGVKVYHYTWNIGDTTLTSAGNVTIDPVGGIVSLRAACLVGNNFVVAYQIGFDELHQFVMKYNIISSSSDTIEWFSILVSTGWEVASISVAPTGDGLLLAASYLLPESEPIECSLFPFTFERMPSVSANIDTWKIDRFGSVSTSTMVVGNYTSYFADTFGYYGGGTVFYNCGFGPMTSDLLTNTVYGYFLVELASAGSCVNVGKYEAHVYIMSLPSGNIFRSWDYEYDPGTGCLVPLSDDINSPYHHCEDLTIIHGIQQSVTNIMYSRFRGPYVQLRHVDSENFGGTGLYTYSLVEMPQYSLIDSLAVDPDEGFEGLDYIASAIQSPQIEDIFNALWYQNYLTSDSSFRVSRHIGSSSHFRTVNYSGSSTFYGPIGNVLAFRFTNRWGLGVYQMYLDDIPNTGILKHTSTSDPLGVTASDLASLETFGVFEVINYTDKPCKVEISKGTPTVVYSVPQSGDSESSILDASVLNTFGSFYSHAEDKQVFCSRVFDLLEPGTFPTISGIFDPGDFERFIAITNTQIEASQYDLTTPWVGIITGGGIINQMETSNYTYPGPYMFYTVSGLGQFHQKNPYESFWHDYSSGFPASDCTVIRMDDAI